MEVSSSPNHRPLGCLNSIAVGAYLLSRLFLSSLALALSLVGCRAIWCSQTHKSIRTTSEYPSISFNNPQSSSTTTREICWSHQSTNKLQTQAREREILGEREAPTLTFQHLPLPHDGLWWAKHVPTLVGVRASEERRERLKNKEATKSSKRSMCVRESTRCCLGCSSCAAWSPIDLLIARSLPTALETCSINSLEWVPWRRRPSCGCFRATRARTERAPVSASRAVAWGERSTQERKRTPISSTIQLWTIKPRR